MGAGRLYLFALVLLVVVSSLAGSALSLERRGVVVESGVLYDASGLSTFMACSGGLCVLAGDRAAGFFYKGFPLSLVVFPSSISDVGLYCSGGWCAAGFQFSSGVVVYYYSLSHEGFRLAGSAFYSNTSLVRASYGLLLYSNGTVYRVDPEKRVLVRLVDLGFKPATSPWPGCYAGGGAAFCGGRSLSGVVFASRTGALVYAEGNESVVLWSGGRDRVEGRVYVAGSFGSGVCYLYSRLGERSVVFRASGGGGVYERDLGPGSLVALVSSRDWCAVSVDDRLYTYTPSGGLSRAADGYFPSLVGSPPIGLHASSMVLQKPLSGNTASYLVVTPLGLYEVNGTSVPGAVVDCSGGFCSAYIPPRSFFYSGPEGSFVVDLGSFVPVEAGFLAMSSSGRSLFLLESSGGVREIASCRSACSVSIQGGLVLLLEESGVVRVVNATSSGAGVEALDTGLEKPARVMVLSTSPLLVAAYNGTHSSLASRDARVVGEGAPETIEVYGLGGLEYASLYLNTSSVLLAKSAGSGRVELFSLNASWARSAAERPRARVCGDEVLLWVPGSKSYYVYSEGRLVEKKVEHGYILGFTGDCREIAANRSKLYVGGVEVCSTEPAYPSWTYTLPSGDTLVGAPPSVYLLDRRGECRALEERIVNPFSTGTRIVVAKDSALMTLSVFLEPSGEIVVVKSSGAQRRYYGGVYSFNPVFEAPSILAFERNEFIVASAGGETVVENPVPEKPYQAVLGPKGVIVVYLAGFAAIKAFASAQPPPLHPPSVKPQPVTSIASTITTATSLTSTREKQPPLPPLPNTTTSPGAATPAANTTPVKPPAGATPASRAAPAASYQALWIPLLIAGLALTALGIALIIRAKKRGY